MTSIRRVAKVPGPAGIGLTLVACAAITAACSKPPPPPSPTDCPADTTPRVVRWGYGDGRAGWAQVCQQLRGPFRLWIDGKVLREGRFDEHGNPTGKWVMETDDKGTVTETRDFGSASDAGDAAPRNNPPLGAPL